VPEALATIAYGYDKLGDKQTSQQYIEVLKLNYPNLVKADGTVNLRAARSEGSWINRATLGVLGREAQSTTDAEQQQNPEDAEKRSFTNRISFGLLDRPKNENSIPAALEQSPEEIPAETPASE
jgi:outer membrane protein assembly factor BamD